MSRKLTANQLSFAYGIIKGLEPSPAYIASSYSSDNMSKAAIAVQAQKLLNNPNIALMIEKAREKALSDSIMTRQEALQILSSSARVKITDVFNFTIESYFAKGEEKQRPVWTIKETEDIAPEVAMCIKSISFDSNGHPKIETYDTHGAIKQLSAMEGWDAPKKTALTDAVGKSVPLSINVNAPEVAQALQNLMKNL